MSCLCSVSWTTACLSLDYAFILRLLALHPQEIELGRWAGGSTGHWGKNGGGYEHQIFVGSSE